MRISKAIALLLVMLCSANAFSEELRLLSFKDAENIALKNSPQILAQKNVTDSAFAAASSQKVKRLPTLELGVQSMFVSKIGQMSVPSLGLTQNIGEHVNWAVTPSLNFVVWDTGQILSKAKALKSSAEAEGNILDYDKRQVLLGARSAYIGVQLAKEQVRLVKEALALAESQYDDIYEKKKVGTADEFDRTVAHQEVVDREKDLEQALGELVVSKRALAAALGIGSDIETADTLDVETINDVLSVLLPRADTKFDAEAHPEVKALQLKSVASELNAKSTFASYFPKVTLKGSAGYEYPNLGVSETIQQNRLTLGLQMPIFEWGSINKETNSYKFRAKAVSEQKQQTIIDLTRNVSETRDWISTFKKLQDANKKVVKDAVEVSRLAYDSFNAGRIIFLEVQRANVKALSAKVDEARNNANLAEQVAKLLALTVDEGDIK